MKLNIIETFMFSSGNSASLGWTAASRLSKGTLDTNLNEVGGNLVASLHMMDWQYCSKTTVELGTTFQLGTKLVSILNKSPSWWARKK